MRPVYAALEYSDAERIYKVSETLDNGLLLDIYIQLHSEKFLEYQKEISTLISIQKKKFYMKYWI